MNMMMNDGPSAGSPFRFVTGKSTINEAAAVKPILVLDRSTPPAAALAAVTAKAPTVFHGKYLGRAVSDIAFPGAGDLSPESFTALSKQLAQVASSAVNPMGYTKHATKVLLSDDAMGLLDLEDLSSQEMDIHNILSFKACKTLGTAGKKEKKVKGVEAVALIMARSAQDTVEIHRIGFPSPDDLVRLFNRLRESFRATFTADTEANIPVPAMTPEEYEDDIEC